MQHESVFSYQVLALGLVAFQQKRAPFMVWWQIILPVPQLLNHGGVNALGLPRARTLVMLHGVPGNTSPEVMRLDQCSEERTMGVIDEFGVLECRRSAFKCCTGLRFAPLGEVFLMDMLGFGGVLLGVVGRFGFGVNCFDGVEGIFFGVFCLAKVACVALR